LTAKVDSQICKRPAQTAKLWRHRGRALLSTNELEVAIRQGVELTGDADVSEIPSDDKAIRGIVGPLAGRLEWRADQGFRFDGSPSSLGITSDLSEIARRLIKEARRSSPSESVERLLRFISENVVDQHEAVVLWGFTPKEATQLLDDVYVIPVADLPDSREKRMVIEESRGTPYEFGARPRAALFRAFRFGPVLDVSLPHVGNPPPESVSRVEKSQAMVKMATALTAAIAAPVYRVFSWSLPDESAPVPIGGKGGGTYQPHAYMDGPVVDVAASPASEVVKAYLDLSPESTDALQIPLSRLNSAKLEALDEYRLADAFLDLGIALEVLLGKKDEKSEIAYRLRTRGAVLRGGDGTRRLGTSAVLNAVYAARSQVAHGGALGSIKVPGRGSVPAAELFREAASITQELIQIVIKQGAIPDWDRLVLGGG
jgi:hypothetical protein